MTRRRIKYARPAAYNKMSRLISLGQEFRAIRRSGGEKSGTATKHLPPPKPTERPWQPDIDLVQHTMREVLHAIASLSGVELPGLPPDLQGDGAPPPNLDIKTVKDRIRHELEGFTVSTAAEMAKQAKEQAHAALDEIQNEVGSRIEQIAAEIREKIQHQLEPGQIENDLSRVIKDHVEKVLEPRVEETVARLERSFQEKVERLSGGQEQLVQKTLPGSLTAVQAQVGTPEQAVQETSELKPVLVVQASAEQLNTAAENEMDEYESRLNNQADKALGQATPRPEWSVKDFLEPHKIQPAHRTTAEIEEQRKATTFNSTDIHSQLQRARELLGGLGLKNSHPSK